MAESIFRELRFNHSGARPAVSTWAEFRPAELPKGRQILHKIPKGYVDLQLSGCGSRVEELNVLNAALLRDGLKFARATKSAALRIEVLKMDVRKVLTAQRAALTALLVGAIPHCFFCHGLSSVF